MQNCLKHKEDPQGVGEDEEEDAGGEHQGGHEHAQDGGEQGGKGADDKGKDQEEVLMKQKMWRMSSFQNTIPN